MNRKPLIYIAGPYTHPDPVINTRQAVAVAESIIGNGMIPHIPHLNLLWHYATHHTPEFWYDYDLHILKRCDGLYRIPGPSKGADLKVDFAHKHQIPVFMRWDALLVHWRNGGFDGAMVGKPGTGDVFRPRNDADRVHPTGGVRVGNSVIKGSPEELLGLDCGTHKWVKSVAYLCDCYDLNRPCYLHVRSEVQVADSWHTQTRIFTFTGDKALWLFFNTTLPIVWLGQRRPCHA